MTIVIHPTDISTDFLMPIYGNIPKEELMVVKGGVSKNELIELIKKHDTVLCLGHGSPFGLFSIGQFNGFLIGFKRSNYHHRPKNLGLLKMMIFIRFHQAWRHKEAFSW